MTIFRACHLFYNGDNIIDNLLDGRGVVLSSAGNSMFRNNSFQGDTVVFSREDLYSGNAFLLGNRPTQEELTSPISKCEAALITMQPQ